MDSSKMTFGDVRRLIVQTILDIQVEINAAKLALQTEDRAHSFGRVARMGQQLIGNGASD